jgi:hypothetical protein
VDYLLWEPAALRLYTELPKSLMKPPESDLDCERANLPFSRNVRDAEDLADLAGTRALRWTGVTGRSHGRADLLGPVPA